MKKKIPYTSDNFPMWAVWIRHKSWSKNHKIQILGNMPKVMFISPQEKTQHVDFEDMELFEIAGTDGEWSPFYREVNACDACDCELEETACTNSTGGSYCSTKCADKGEQKKWKPKGGAYFVSCDGDIEDSGSFDDALRLFGTQYATKEQAEKARDQMRVFNLLLARKMEEVEKGMEEEVSHYVIHRGEKIYHFYSLSHLNIVGLPTFTKEVAQKICEELNDEELNFLTTTK